MLTSSAYEIIEIEPFKDYSINTKTTESPVYRIHVTKTNESPVSVLLYKGTPINFPPGSFVQGAIYDMFIARMDFDSTKCGFVGYKYKIRPYSLDL